MNGTEIRKKINSDFLLIVTQLIIYTFACNLLLVSTLYFFNITITWIILPVCFMLSVFLTCLIGSERSVYVFLLEIFVSVMIFLIASVICECFMDMSWDGNTYHKLAIGLLRNHWNPLKMLPPLNWIEGDGAVSQYTLWVEAYCKQTWIWGASIYAITNNIESGKSYTILAIICALFLSFYFCRKYNKGILVSCIFSLAAATNPIAIQQWDSFYIDGYMQLFLYMLVVSLVMLYEDSIFNKKISYSLVFSLMIICGNIKFTGLLYGGIFCITYFLLDCIKYFKSRKGDFKRLFAKECIFYFIILFISLFWAGNSSYLTNLIRHGNLTYPLSGPNKVDIMSYNSPFDETKENRIINFLISMFSKMDNCRFNSERHPVFKIPFTVDWEKEKLLLRTTDSRLSGFGVLFSGLFIVSIVIIVTALIVMERNEVKKIIFVNVIVCLSLIFAIKESWWARYTPYVYFLVLLALFILFGSKKMILQRVSALFAVLLLINNLTPLIWMEQDFELSKKTAANIAKMSGSVVDVYSETFKGIYFNLDDAQIKYVVDKNLANDAESIEAGYRDLRWKQR